MSIRWQALASRLTKIVDYDGLELEYAFDAAGRMTSMTDYHGAVTAYEYDGANRMTKLTGPGNKNWTYWYNALGQPIEVLLPNGMMTVYDYDEDHQHRMTKISHKNSPVGSGPRRVWADTQVRPYGAGRHRVPVVRI